MAACDYRHRLYVRWFFRVFLHVSIRPQRWFFILKLVILTRVPVVTGTRYRAGRGRAAVQLHGTLFAY